MRLSAIFIRLLVLGAAGAGAYGAADLGATWLEDTTAVEVDRRLALEGHEWSSVYTDGLQVILSGEAPSEAERFKALAAAGKVVEAARVIDNIQIEATQELEAPEFSLEILRNDGGISLIGLVPAGVDRDNVLDRVNEIAGGDKPVSDFMETADYPVPDEWASALSFGLTALETLERAKISIGQNHVDVTAIGESIAQKARLEATLGRRTPANITTNVNISAPRPVITPFTLRFTKDADRTGFDACSADTPEAAIIILAAAKSAGMDEDATCREGLGVPTPTWAQAAATSINAVRDLDGGTVTITDADVALVALEGTDQATFDGVVARLEADLPPLFALTSKLPVAAADAEEQQPPSFTAATQDSGQMQLRGDVGNALKQDTVTSFAQAQFGAKNILTAIRSHPDLPTGWAVRVMAGLEGLATLNNGRLAITEDTITIAGNTGSTTAGADISRIMTDRLGDAVNFSLDVKYIKALDPIANQLTPADCVAEIIALTNAQKISFEPGSVNLDSGSRSTVDKIAEILDRCPAAEIEISGHTDSQGGEDMNQSLSRERAQAVLTALRIKRVNVKTLVAEGYGETQPIATNDTPEGREENRRI
ncbi:MAG: OmpA family protein, partial [Planktomarina sp.]